MLNIFTILRISRFITNRLGLNKLNPVKEIKQESQALNSEYSQLMDSRLILIHGETLAESGIPEEIDRVNVLIESQNLNIPLMPVPEIYQEGEGSHMSIKLPNQSIVGIYSLVGIRDDGLSRFRSIVTFIEYVNFYLKPQDYQLFIKDHESAYLLNSQEYNQLQQSGLDITNLKVAIKQKYFGDFPGQFPVLGLGLYADKFRVENKWVSFGDKTHWIALKNNSLSDVAEILGLKNIHETSQPGGFAAIESISVDYPLLFNPLLIIKVDDWVIITGSLFINLKKDLPKLSAKHSDVQYFANHKVTDSMEFKRYLNDTLVRHISVDEGKLEVSLGSAQEMREDELMMEQDTYDCEVTTMNLAEKFSVNPTKLELRNDQPSLALIGIVDDQIK